MAYRPRSFVFATEEGIKETLTAPASPNESGQGKALLPIGDCAVGNVRITKHGLPIAFWDVLESSGQLVVFLRRVRRSGYRMLCLVRVVSTNPVCAVVGGLRAEDETSIG